MKFLLSVAAVIAVAVAVPTQRGLVTPGAAGPAPAPEIVEPIAVGPAIIDSFEPIAVGPAVIESAENLEIQAIIAAIQSPSTDPATAAVLEQMLLEALGIHPEPIAVGPAVIETAPISVGPAIIDSVFEPIAVGPALVDFPMPDGGVAVEPVVVPSPAPVVAPSPVSIVHGPVDDVSTDGAPLVQIILNINQAAAESSPIAVTPVVVPEAVQPTPVQVVETAPVAVEPVQVVETAPVAVEPVQVVETAPAPVQVVETAPVAVEPVVIGTPVLPVAVEPVIIGTPIIPEAAVILPEQLN